MNILNGILKSIEINNLERQKINAKLLAEKTNESWIEKYMIKNIYDDKFIFPENKKEYFKLLSNKKNTSNIIFTGKSSTGKTIIANHFGNLNKSKLFTTSNLNYFTKETIQYIEEYFQKGYSIVIDDFDLVNIDVQIKIYSIIESTIHLLRTENTCPKSLNLINLKINLGKFIFTVNNEDLIYEKIKDVCISIIMDPISEDSLLKILENICKDKNFLCDKKNLQFINFISEGNLKIAINILQTSYFYQLNKTNNVKKLELKNIEIICKMSDLEKIKSLLETIKTGNLNKSLETLDSLLMYVDLEGNIIINTIIQLLCQDDFFVLSTNKNIDVKLFELQIFDAIEKYRERVGNNANSIIQLTNLMNTLVSFFLK